MLRHVERSKTRTIPNVYLADRSLVFKKRGLPRCPRRFPSSTLRMPALAGDRWLLADALAIVAAVFAALRYRALAPRMRTPLSSFFGHDKPPCLSVTTSRNRRQWPWGYLTSIQMDYATHSFAAITPTNCFAHFPVFQKSVFPDCSRRSGANSGLILAIQRWEGSQSSLRSCDLMDRHSSTAITLSRHAKPSEAKASW